MTTTSERTKADELQAIGKSAYESIAEMVAALECDYERLEELRDERDGYEPHDGIESIPGVSLAEQWALDLPDDAEELADLERDAGDCKDRDEAEQRIREDALSVRIFGERINGEWEADKFEILLTTGGPAVRIMGELDGNSEPSHAYLEVQDWFQPWTEYVPADRDTLLTYCRCFCFE